MDEATAFLNTLERTPPGAPTACAGWTAHELVAHLAAGAAEMAGAVEDALAGRVPRPTRSFEEREAPYRALGDDEQRERLVAEALRLTLATGALGGAGDGATAIFSGDRLDAVQLTMHGRSEAALHRWDLAGDDEISRELLCQPELTVHAVEVLNHMLPGAAESPPVRAGAARLVGPREGTAAFPDELRLASPGHPDVVVLFDDVDGVDGLDAGDGGDGGEAGARFELTDPGRRPTVTMAADVRLLALWGRRSSLGRLAGAGVPGSLTWGDDTASAKALSAFLWGREA